MGISGLLPLLKSIHKPCSLKAFAGQTVGVDAYGWLHRGAVTCPVEAALGKPCRRHIDFSMHRVRMLLHFGITPFIVFDGDYLPSKAATEMQRAQRRKDSIKIGLELLQKRHPQAQQELRKAIDVTPAMARELIEELKKAGVRYIVAPYEADAQLVYLEKNGHISAILSEDSDMLVFGAKRLLTKLDQYGECVEIDRADFAACKEINLAGWTDAQFRRMAILSGCDYLANIGGMGLKNAYRLVRKHDNIERIIRMLHYDGKNHIPDGYIEAFTKADLTFLYQRVFCPDRKRMVMLTEDAYHDHMPEDLSFLGQNLEDTLANAIAIGDVDPMTKLPFKFPKSLQTQASSSKSSICMSEPRSTSHPKGNQSIGAYFKSQRQPLVELSPNVRTPSSGQPRTIESPAQEASSQNLQAAKAPKKTMIASKSSAPSDCFELAARYPESFVKTSMKAGSKVIKSRFFEQETAIGSKANTNRVAEDSSRTFDIWTDESIKSSLAEITQSTSNKTYPEPSQIPALKIDNEKVALPDEVQKQYTRGETDRRNLQHQRISDLKPVSPSNENEDLEWTDSPSQWDDLDNIDERQFSCSNDSRSLVTVSRTYDARGRLIGFMGPPMYGVREGTKKQHKGSTPLQRLGMRALNRPHTDIMAEKKRKNQFTSPGNSSHKTMRMQPGIQAQTQAKGQAIITKVCDSETTLDFATLSSPPAYPWVFEAQSMGQGQALPADLGQNGVARALSQDGNDTRKEVDFNRQTYGSEDILIIPDSDDSEAGDEISFADCLERQQQSMPSSMHFLSAQT